MKILSLLKNNRISLLFVFILFSMFVQAVGTSYYFYVQFTDKNNSPYSLSNPSAYLSARSIERRAHRASTYDSTDLPINPVYLQQVEALGIHVHCRSKWLNGATVLLTDTSKMSLVRALSFVKFVQYTGLNNGATPFSSKKKMVKASSNYGNATTQIDQLNGKYLHNLGFRGKGITIAVIDAGFNNVNVNHAFDSLRFYNRILGSKDIINPTSNIYAEDAHGANVLSTMAGNLPTQYLGTAPDASYWLIRTEYAPTEYLVETDFWCTGIEFADSVGVDVVNSSLGYTEFDDPSMNFTYSKMNGTYSRATLAANLAAKKGIIVCSSAGNEGNKPWKYISSPADAKGIIAVGGITTSLTSSTFSSYGPSYDGRVKPEICSLGTSSAIVNTSGLATTGNGTSYASPIMAGMMACFLQAAKTTYPACNVEILLKSVFESASHYLAPTEQLGYGIPNFQTALAKLPFSNAVKITETKNLIIAYNTNDNTIYIRLFNQNAKAFSSVQIYSITGRLKISQEISDVETTLNANSLMSGMYIVSFTGIGKPESHKLIIR